MKNIGKEEGINFSYGGTVGSTIDSHRLVEWATERGKQDEVIEELFKLYFENEGNIVDLQELAAVAGRIGLNETEVSSLLSGGLFAIICMLKSAFHRLWNTSRLTKEFNV